MDYYLKRNETLVEGIQQGIAQQKARDEVLFKKNKEELAQKDKLLNKQSSLLSAKDEKIHQLQEKLKATGLTPTV